MKFTKGHDYVKTKMDYFTFLCTLSDELYICTKFQEISQRVSGLSGHMLKFTKGIIP